MSKQATAKRNVNLLWYAPRYVSLCQLAGGLLWRLLATASWKVDDATVTLELFKPIILFIQRHVFPS
jgi:hypothetical protein